jgi:site-specific recombinase XerD
VVWGDGQLWTEANLWLYERSKSTLSGSLRINSVQNNGADLFAYAKWLEENDGLHWRHFPKSAELRCLNLYRGALIAARDAGDLAPSLATRRMRSLVRFYRWIQAQGIMRSDFPLWDDRIVSIRLLDAHGFARTMSVTSSDLAIPYTSSSDSTRLEDGAEPVSSEHRNAILALARQHASIELYYMLAVGFSNGMRLGSITDLKIRTLERAVPVHGTDKVMAIAIGPEAEPPVATKFGKSGRGILMPVWLREELLDYAVGVRRGKREKLASPADKDLVFLTKTGARYAARGVNKSATINGEMSRLRKVARAHGVDMERFTFHWTRATFATGWAQAAVDAGKGDEFMPALKDMMLHKDEATTWRYIKFVKNQKVRAELADLFTREMFGILSNEGAAHA